MNGHRFWIGGKYNKQKRLVWVNGKELSYTNWSSSSPVEDQKIGISYYSYDGSYKWNCEPIQMSFFPICKVE